MTMPRPWRGRLCKRGQNFGGALATQLRDGLGGQGGRVGALAVRTGNAPPVERGDQRTQPQPVSPFFRVGPERDGAAPAQRAADRALGLNATRSDQVVEGR